MPELIDAGPVEVDEEEDEFSCCDDGCCESCHPECWDNEEEEQDVPYRSFSYGPWQNDSVEGTYMTTHRTVGVEFERGSMYPAPGHDDWDSQLMDGVGIDSDHCGIEVKTPPASGLAADEFTEHTLKTLIEAGFPTGNDSGLHVHVHFPEGYGNDGHERWNHDTQRYEWVEPESAADAGAMSKFCALWAAVEHIAFRFCPGRRNCSWSRQQVRSRAERLEYVHGLLDDARNGREPARNFRYYGSVNTGQSGYKTLEFRGHYSTDDVPHVLAWVAFVQGIVELSARISYIGIIRIAEATSHDERARMLMQYGRRHGVWTPTAYAAIRRELGLRPARTVWMGRAA